MHHGLGWRPIRTLVAFATLSALALSALGCLPAAALAQPAGVLSPVTPPVPVFTDVRGDEWFAEAVHALAAKGVVRGRADDSFGPDEAVSRAQMAMFLARVLELPESFLQPFTDVNSRDAFAGAVGALYQRGLV